jgi:hypothetical protein
MEISKQTAIKILMFPLNHQTQIAVPLLFSKWTAKLMTMTILISNLRIGRNKEGKNNVKLILTMVISFRKKLKGR